MKKKVAISFLIILLNCVGFAQEKGDRLIEKSTVKLSDSTNNLTGITVTSTRKNTANWSVPYSVSVVNKSQLDAFGFRSTPEALSGTAGVFVQKTNHGGGSPFIRGLTGNQTLLLMDGIRLNNATYRYGPNQYLNTIDPSVISKIEVARGTGSVQYGSDALGGVVQLFTQSPEFIKGKALHSTFRSRVTSQDMEYGGRAEMEYQSNNLAILGGYSGVKFGDLVGGDTTVRQNPSGYQQRAFDFKLKYQLAPGAILTIAHQWLRQKEVPLYHKVKLENFNYYFFDPQQRQMSYAKLVFTGKNKLLDKISIISSLQKSFERREYQKNGNSNQFTEEDRVNTWGNVLDVFSEISKNWTANSGVEYYHDQVNSNKQQQSVITSQTVNLRGLYPNNASSGNFSIYSLHHFTKGKFDIESGLRYNSFTIRIPDTFTSALKLGDIRVSPSSLVSNVALLYHIGTVQNVYASFSTGYRAPNIDDLGSLGLVDFRYEIPAYQLKPEKTYNTEIGYRINTKKIQSSLSFFYMHLTDLITRVQLPGQQIGGYNVYTKENSQQSYIKGVELSFNYRITNSFTLTNNVTYAYGQNLSAKEPMRRIPPVNGRILLNYQKGKWNFNIENLFAAKQNRLAKGDKDDNRIPAGGTPGWSIFNLYGNYSFQKLALFTRVQNIFNQDYRTHGSGINGVGRSASLGIQISL
jgi:outer membrane receptor protein involved in Fe transport